MNTRIPEVLIGMVNLEVVTNNFDTCEKVLFRLGFSSKVTGKCQY